MANLLAVNFFPAFTPPASGGELRYFHFYKQLSQNFHVTLLSPTYSTHKRESINHSPTLVEHRIPKDPIFDQIHAAVASENIAEEFSALVCALTAKHPNSFHEAFLEAQAEADVIVHESPYMLDYDVLFGYDGRPRIYNSYNVESDLVAHDWKGPHAAKHLAHIEALERRLSHGATACFAVSQRDILRFEEKFGIPSKKFLLAPNGIEPRDFLRTHSSNNSGNTALFFGSFHPPNIEAANYIASELAPALPDVEFVIAGSCATSETLVAPQNVKILGRVDEETRKQLFSTARIALNPMFSGGGTNLKTLEYLAAKIPTVLTELGARGLGLKDGEHVVLADKTSFVNSIQELIQSESLRERLSAKGKEHVEENFTWSAIAAHAKAFLNNLLCSWHRPSKPTLLALNDFPCSTPTGGGEIRINRIYSRLASKYRIVLICLTGDQYVRVHQVAPDFLEICIPKSASHRAQEDQFNREWYVSAADIVSYLEAPNNRLLRAHLSAFTPFADAVILIHPYMAGLLQGQQIVPVVYESLNVETTLKKKILQGHPSYDQLTIAAAEAETHAIALSSAVLAVSKEDKFGLEEIGASNDRIFVVPNGVDVPEGIESRAPNGPLRQLLGDRRLLTFLGSAHPPNIEAARYITESLAPLYPECLFALIGSVCSAIGSEAPPNVLLLGTLSLDEKDLVLQRSDLGLNPMLSGSGSNLKLADYFSKALPTITTNFGARGYSITHGNEAFVCDIADFASTVRCALDEPRLARRIGDAGFRYARTHLDWSLQADKFDSALKRTIRGGDGLSRILFVTHRFTDPPLGGAEVYLLELIKELNKKGDFLLDVATTDIVQIRDEYQFSCAYERDVNHPYPSGLAHLKVERFPIEEISRNERIENARTLYSAWMEENRADSLKHLARLPKIILLGGWYFPERTSEDAEVWASERAFIKVSGASSIRLRGYVGRKCQVTFLSGGAAIVNHSIANSFDLTIELESTEVLEIRVEPPLRPDDDPRTLGIRVQHAICASAEGEVPVLLERTYREHLREHHAEQYVQTLIDTAERRGEALNRLFLRTRGPNSVSLQKWLREHAQNYDVIVGHCAPFNTIVYAAEAANAAGVPLIEIPHFHFDDSFYHWKGYYEALKAAKCSIVHPRISGELFFERIGAPYRYLPLGLHFDAESCAMDERGFEALYGNSLPFVLVLGRKSRTKNYEQVVQAIDCLNASGVPCKLVMIGRDEDGRSISSGNTVYLGGQPDTIVNAAIHRAVCLVSMSVSESFGIVILEAWRHRTPVIVSQDCQAYRELVTDGVDGLLANSETLVERIRFCLQAPTEAHRMGASGENTARSRYDWRQVSNQLVEIVDRINVT